jgi:hypothetical protein
MATHPYKLGASLLFLALFGFIAFGQTVKAPAPAGAVTKEEQFRKAWLDSSAAEAWVREKTNRNDHPRIVVYNKAAGSFANGPYCAAGLYFTATRAGMTFPIRNPASVASWFSDSKKIIYDRRQPGRFKSLPQTMDVVWLYRSHIEGLAQPVRRDVDEDDYITTVAFNSQGNNPKQGVYFPMRRRWRDVRKVANYVTPYVRNLEKPNPAPRTPGS